MTESNCWKLFDAIIGATPRILLYGVPGTGKTYQANTTNLEGRNTYNVTLTQDSSASELLGHYVLNETGGMDWLDGIGVQAWKDGARLVVNEIDHAGVDVMSFLHALLDDPEFAKFTLPNKRKETVRPQPSFQVIATMNGVPEDLPEALLDRFPVKINIDTVHPSALESLPEKFRSVYADYNNGAFSIRRWIALGELLDKEVNLEFAVQTIFPDEYEEITDALVVALNSDE
jgi:MoxR-like ATPase|tara:strand:- start:9969 stop:10661 length:693 start_codon:yes stop_codon:yes gene_type:complete